MNLRARLVVTALAGAALSATLLACSSDHSAGAGPADAASDATASDDASPASDGGGSSDAGACNTDSGTSAVPDGAVQIALPGTPPGIRFDDMRFSPNLGAVVVPAGHTGNVDLVDSTTHAVTALSGLTSSPCYDDTGASSADEGAGLVYAIDKTSMQLDVADPTAKKVVASAPLASSPDVVRFVPTTKEVWVTESSATPPQIEIFSVATPASPVFTGKIQVAGGVERLEIDALDNRAYTQSGGTTVGLDLNTHAVVASWNNTCGSGGAHGLAIDAMRGFLVLVCSSGNVVTLRLSDGTVLDSVSSTATGADVTGYNPALAHFYVAGGTSQTLAVVGVSNAGALQVLGSFPTVAGARCVVSDLAGSAYVCDPAEGSILVYADKFPAGAPDAGLPTSDAGGDASNGAPDAGGQ
jgi:hypothetical protein